MKRTNRLTALLLALLMLLNLSASATETTNGIPLAELDKALYSTLLTDAEAVGQAANQECGANNPYCASVTKIVDMTTAQERYDYLSGRSSLEIIGILMHYRDCKAEHTEEDVICLCSYPNFAADHVPGGITQPVECPWHFANLTVAEQFEQLRDMNESQRQQYMNLLDADKKEELTAYLNMISIAEPCNPKNCELVAKYGVDFFSINTFSLYEFMYDLYVETKSANGEPSTEISTLVEHLRDRHIAEDVYCQCGSFVFTNPDLDYGRKAHTGSSFGSIYFECPWRFNALTMEEQAHVLSEIAESEHSSYYNMLTPKQRAELEAFMAGIGKTEETITSKNPDNADETLVEVKISVPTGVFGSGVEHVMEAEEALMTTEKVSALNQVMIGHTLAAFDISFYNLNRPGEKLQPVNGTVPLTFTVDVSEAGGNVMQVYHLIENANGTCTAEAVGEPIPVDKTNGTQEITINASSFSTYALRMVCDDGVGSECFYYDFIKLDGFERHEVMGQYINVPDGDHPDRTMYYELTAHMNSFHLGYGELPPYCTCADYESNYDNLGYGSIEHDEDSFNPGGYCAWHLVQLEPEDQYTVISGLTDATEKQEYLDALETAGKLDEYNAYVESLNPVEPEEPKTLLEIYEVYQQMTDEEKQAYLESLSPEMRDKLLRVNVTAYTATAANSSTVSIEVPEGAFGENYLLNAAEAEVTAEIQSALDILAVENGEETVGTLVAFDISFGNLSTEQGMQPGAAVELTFDIPTASISEDAGALAVFHMVENSEGSYTAEVVGAIGIDTELEMQKIAVNATAFSIYVVGSVGASPSGSTYTEYGMDVGDKVVFYSSNRVNNTNTSEGWRVGNTALTDGVAYTGNAAFIITPNGRYITVEKIADGEIELNYRVQYRSWGTQNADDRINIIGPEEVTFRPNGGSGSNYVMIAESGAFVFPTLEETGITPPDGAEFAGWATSTTGYDTYAANIEGRTSTGKTYYARWYYPEATGTTRAYFFLRTDGAIQYEPATYGTAMYYPKPGSNGSSPRVDDMNGGYLHTPIAINNNLDAVAANIAVEPTAEMINAMLAYNNGGGGTFDPETQEVVWYVIKYTSNAWHVDGVIRQKALFNVSYHPNGGNTNVPASVQYAKDVTVTVDYQKVPSRIGYVFMGWDEDPTASSPTYDYDTKSPTSFVMPERNVDLYAIWRPSDATEYKVEHYLVETDGSTALRETTIHYGTTDSTVNARPRNYEGYALDSDYPGSIPSGVVAADGSLVLKLYYVRSLGNMKLTKVIDDPTFTSGTKLFSFTIQPSGSLPTSDEFVRWAEEKGFAVSGNVVTTGITVIHPAMTNSIQLSGLPTGSYKVTELNAEGYDTTYSPEDGIVTVTAGDTAAEITVTNEVSTGSLTVTKNVPDVSGDVDALPDQTFSFVIELIYPDGSTETKTASLKRGETATFNDIPAGTTYTVTETAVDYFVTTKTGDTGTIAAGATSAAVFTNTYTKLKTGSLTITKNLVDSTFKSGSRTFTFTVQPSEGASDVMKKQFAEWAGADAKTVTITLIAPNETASETLTGLPVGSYTVTETGLEPYAAYYKSSDVRTVNASVTTAGGTAAITNNAELTDLSVTKNWVDYSAATRPEKIKVSVMNGNDTLHSEEFTVDDSTNQKTYTFSRQFAKYDLQGNAIEYSFAEDAVANYSISISGSSITNTIKTTSLTITKAGNVGSDESFIFTVTSAQTDYDTTVVIKGAGTITISGLPIGDTITVAEQTDWSWKYTAAYEGLTNGSITLVDGTNAVKVTNTPKTEQWLYDESSEPNVFTKTKTEN